LPVSWHCYLNERAGATTTASRPLFTCNRTGSAYSQSRGCMRLLQIRARADADADCLMRELAAYSPTRSRSGIQIELEERSEVDVLGVLAAVET
jgi:hypothetical protein